MVHRKRIKDGIVLIERSDGIFLGHIDRHLIIRDKRSLPLLRQLREWQNPIELSTNYGYNYQEILSVLAELENSDFLEVKRFALEKIEIEITHMNEVGILLASALIEKGITVTTRDARKSKLSDVRALFLRISDVGQSFTEVLANQKREMINSGSTNQSNVDLATRFGKSKILNLEFSSENNGVYARRKIVVITAYPEPELLAELMETGVEHLCALATPFGAHIGPYVKPGSTPCFHCIALHRSDNDGQWQQVAAALFIERGERVELAHALFTVAILEGYLHRLINGELPHDELSRSVSYSLATHGEEKHIWGFHPDCSCHWGGRLSTRVR